MFCMKCGQSLPDDALFCSICGTKTHLGQNAFLEKESISQKNNIENEKTQTAKKQAEIEWKEKIAKLNEETRKALSDSLEKVKQAKAIRVIIFGIIAGISALVALASFSSVFSGEKITEGLLITAFMSFAITLGVLCETGIICYQFNKKIQGIEIQLNRFDDEVRISKEDF